MLAKCALSRFWPWKLDWKVKNSNKETRSKFKTAFSCSGKIGRSFWILVKKFWKSSKLVHRFDRDLSKSAAN